MLTYICQKNLYPEKEMGKVFYESLNKFSKQAEQSYKRRSACGSIKCGRYYVSAGSAMLFLPKDLLLGYPGVDCG